MVLPKHPLLKTVFSETLLSQDSEYLRLFMQVKPELRKLIEAMPLNEGLTSNMTGAFNVGALLPEERSYFTYEGSLTTPPCT